MKCKFYYEKENLSLYEERRVRLFLWLSWTKIDSGIANLLMLLVYTYIIHLQEMPAQLFLIQPPKIKTKRSRERERERRHEYDFWVVWHKKR